MRMPRTVHLVKQLRRELNFSDAVKSLRKQGGNLLGMSEGGRGGEARGRREGEGRGGRKGAREGEGEEEGVRD